MRINNCSNRSPVFSAQFAKDVQTKNILNNELKRSDACWAYLVHKYMPKMGTGTVAIKQIENDMLELSNSATGHSVQYPNDGGFFFNLVDMITFNAFNSSHLLEHHLNYAHYDHDCMKFFGVQPLWTEPDVILLGDTLKEIEEKSGTGDLSKKMGEIIDMEYNNPVQYKKNKEVLSYQFETLYNEKKKKVAAYIASLYE